MIRNGKIARLPREIRDELNRRLAVGEQGGSLLPWLNTLPAVQAVLAREFGGVPVSKQNLSEWRAGGFVEWQSRQDMLEQTRELAADAREISAATDGKLTDHLATVLAARYAAALSGWDGEVDESFRRKLRVLRGLCQDIVELRRGDHSGARLGLEQDRLECEKEKSEEEVVEHFQRWLQNPAVRDLVCANWISPEERDRRMREIFGLDPKPEKTPEENDAGRAAEIRNIYGLPPEPPAAATAENGSETSPTGPESNPVKPIFMIRIIQHRPVNCQFHSLNARCRHLNRPSNVRYRAILEATFQVKMEKSLPFTLTAESLLNEDPPIVENVATSPLPFTAILNRDGSSLTNVVATAVQSQSGTPAVSFDPNDEVLVGDPSAGNFFIDTTNNEFYFNIRIVAPSFAGAGGNGALTNLTTAVAPTVAGPLVTTNPATGQLQLSYNAGSLTNFNLANAAVNGLPGLSVIETVITNTTGPHGWTNFFGNGILTNRIPW